MIDKLLGGKDIIHKSLDASWIRNQAIVDNIANVDTPNYKRKDIQFDAMLQSALAGGGSLDERVEEINEHIEDFSATSYTDNSSLSYRLDGNNVDIDTESAYLAENQIRYNALVEQMSQEFNRYKTVLQ